MTRQDRRNGFTLIEVVAGLIILTIGLLGVGAMQIISIQSGYFSDQIGQATHLAQNKLEYLRNLPYGDSGLSSGEHNEETIPGGPFSVKYHVEEDVGNSMKTITVNVQWADRRNHNISFSTIRSKQ